MMEKSSNHYYLICFNLRAAEIDIIDNDPNDIDDISVKYGNVPNAIVRINYIHTIVFFSCIIGFKFIRLIIFFSQVDSFVEYLRKKGHPKCSELLKAKPKHLKLNHSFVGNDSGVFVMRYMETYLGRGTFSHDLKEEEEGLKRQLKMLRVKFLTKMILLEINDQREVILKEANAFVKKQKESSKLVTNDNVNDNQDLLEKITERVKMITQ